MKKAVDLIAVLKEQGLTLSVAESCTGGLLADAFVSVAGASAVFAGGAVCYQTPAKTMLLGVNPTTVATHSVVSEEVAIEMAEGCAKAFSTPCAISVTGVAGPKTPNDPAPVGTVYIGLKTPTQTSAVCVRLKGNRQAVRRKSAKRALAEMYSLLKINH